MAAMLVFPFYFLRSFAYAGLAVVAVAALGAVVVLPALLTVLGGRVNAWDVRPPLRRLLPLPARTEGDVEQGFWRRVASGCHAPARCFRSRRRRRAPRAGRAVPVCPVWSAGRPCPACFGQQPSGGQRAQRRLRPEQRQRSRDRPAERGRRFPAQLSAYAARLSLVKGVRGVVSPEGTFVSGTREDKLSTPVVGTSTYFTLENNVNPNSSAGQHLVSTAREVPAPAEALVTGPAARNLDSLNALGGTLPLALGLIALSTLVVLFAFTRSVLIPFKALVLNLLSLSATFGAMVWIFQEGHLSGLLGGVGATGYLNASMPVLMFCIAFGLSMDYEVFLLSRIKEEWDRSDHSVEANTAAVATGLARTGRLVTAAAALISIVFIAVATSQVSFIKLFGVGMALAVLMDATLVRGILVPAFMRLAGRANWWAPRWLSARSRREPRLHVSGREYELPSA